MATQITPVYYVTAHEDDFQLFRGEVAWNDLQRSDVYGIFITATAGDNAQTDGWWQAREAAQKASINACLPDGTWLTEDKASVNGHSIQRVKFSDPTSNATRAVLYSLRLWDGGMDGNGPNASKPPQGADLTYPSLQHLQEGKVVTQITAVDGSTTYTSWADFVLTLRTIMTNEFQTATAGADPSMAVNKPWVNANKYWLDGGDTATDHHNDHSDHVTLGQALYSFMFGSYNQAWWLSYEISSKDPNLTGDDLTHKKHVYNAYMSVMQDQLKDSDANKDEYKSCMNWEPKSYWSSNPWNVMGMPPVPGMS